MKKEQDIRGWEAEIDALIAKHHGDLPRSKAEATGSIYARYSTDKQHSVVDQVRQLLEFATAQRIYIARDKVFADYGIRGASERRPGLDQLKTATQAKAFQTLLVFSTNRLYRKQYKAVRYVEEEIVEKGLRCIFVSQKIDTADTKKWRLLLNLYGMMDEAYTGAFSDNIRAAHVGLARERYVNGTVAFGYKGVVVPGQLTKQKKPRRILEIDEVKGNWVKQIFSWFATDGLTINEIVRRLNDDPTSPRPAKSPDGLWSHGSVRRILVNPRYRGFVIYGLTESTWLSAKDYVRQFERDEPLYIEQCEDLRLVTDELWFQAQRRLAKLRPQRGRKPANKIRQLLSRILNGLFYCPEHGQLYTAGPGAGILYCPDCRNQIVEKRNLFTLLDRELALQVICKRIRDLLSEDTDLVAQIIRLCQEAAGQLQRPDERRIAILRAQEAEKSRQIAFVIRDLGETEEDQAETAELVRTLRKERAEIRNELAHLLACGQRTIKVPTDEEVRAEIERIHEIMSGSLESMNDEQCGMVRQLIHLLTGGRIDLVQMGERRKYKGWLRGSFDCQLPHVLAESLAAGPLTYESSTTRIEVDFVRTNPLDVLSETAKRLYDQNLMGKEIALAMKCSMSQVTKLLKHWFESRGQKLPDGRHRRRNLPRDPAAAPLHERLAEAVMRRYQTGLPLQSIAQELGCDRNVVTAAVRFWHESNGLPVSDGRARRRLLREQTLKGPDAA